MAKGIRYRLHGTGGPQQSNGLMAKGFRTRKDVERHIKEWHLRTIKDLVLRIEEYEV